jgi:hypothetical protein
MKSRWLARDSSRDVAVYVVWSAQRGAMEHHVDGATTLILDDRVRHYWDPDSRVGGAYEKYLGLDEPAWDVWMLFDRDASWTGAVPTPDWWEHQLGALPDSLHLDPARFAREARRLEAAGGS